MREGEKGDAKERKDWRRKEKEGKNKSAFDRIQQNSGLTAKR